MTTPFRTLAIVAVTTSLPGCVLAKSIGEVPELMEGTDDGGDDGSTGGGMDSATSQGPGSASSAGGSATSAGSASAGDSATATSGGGFPGPEACGIEPVPEGLPGYMYSFSCAGGCTFEYVVPLPLDDYESTSNCLCDAAGRGEPSGEVGEVGGGPGGTGSYDGVCDVVIEPNEGPGYFEGTCLCQTCDVKFEDIDMASVRALALGCDCICLEAGCGYAEGSVGGEDGGESSGGGSEGTTSGGA